MIQTLELFGGIGAPRAALRNIGIPVKAIDYVEIDEKAVRSYNAMFDHEHHAQNVVGWNLRPDLLIHGSPCQDFSIAGHQKGGDEGSDTRSSLMWETVHIIEQMGEWMPKVVVWENVKNVLSKYMMHNFDKYISYMKKLGYTSSYAVLDARDFGLPQARQRVFTVSVLKNKVFVFSLLQKKATENINDYLENKTPDYYIVRQPSMLKKINCNNSSFGGRVAVIKDYAMTITCKQMRCPNSGVVDLKNGYFRYLTERECWRLQGFSDKDFNASLSVCPSKPNCLNGTLYKQAGNSMPVPVLESLFREIFEGNYL